MKTKIAFTLAMLLAGFWAFQADAVTCVDLSDFPQWFAEQELIPSLTDFDIDPSSHHLFLAGSNSLGEGVLAIYDLNTLDGTPEEISTVTVSEHGLTCVDVNPNLPYFVYVGTDGGEIIYVNITNPANPQVYAAKTIPGRMYRDIAGKDNGKVLAIYNTGLEWITEGGQYELFQVDELELGTLTNQLEINEDGSLAFVTAGDLQVIGISTELAHLATLQTGDTAQGIALVGNTIYLADRSAGLKVVDVSVPGSPAQIGSLGGLGYCWDLDVNTVYSTGEDRVYISYDNAPDGSEGLAVIDVNDPQLPAFIANLPKVNNSPGKVFARYRDWVLVNDQWDPSASARNGLDFFSVGNAERVYQNGPYPTPGVAEDLAFDGRFAYIAQGGEGLAVWDVPFAKTYYPQFQYVGFVGTGGYANDVILGDGVAYMACEGVGQNGVAVIDISDPTSPRNIRTFGTPVAVKGLTLVGDILVAAGSTTAYLIDANDNQANPVQIPGLTEVNCVASYGSLLYVFGSKGDFDNNLHTFLVYRSGNDLVAQPIASSDTGNTSPGKFALSEDGKFAFVAVDDELQMFTAAGTLTQYPDHSQTLLGRSVKDVWVLRDKIYVACGANGIQAFEYSGTGYWDFNMRPLGFADTANPAVGILVSGDRMMVADQEGLLFVYNECSGAPELSVEVSGPSKGVVKGVTYTWEAEVAGGEEPIVVRWYYKTFKDAIYQYLGEGTTLTTYFTTSGTLVAVATDAWGTMVNDNHTITITKVVKDPHEPHQTRLLDNSDKGADAAPEFHVYQNAPNPFNPRTTFQFSLPEAEHVTLRVFDMRGHLADTVTDRVYPAGTHAVEFDGTHLASGVYYYTLTAGSETVTKKMALLK